jgi:hypothetical protein
VQAAGAKQGTVFARHHVQLAKLLIPKVNRSDLRRDFAPPSLRLEFAVAPAAPC